MIELSQKQRQKVFTTLRQIYYSKTFLRIIAGFGMFVQLAQYLFNRSLWVDEVGVALDMMDRSYAEILPLFAETTTVVAEQSAPTGYLLVGKLLVQLFGSSEYVMRLLPFLCGILSIVLFLKLLLYFVRPVGIPVALLLFITSNQVIYYATALKHYEIDLFCTLLLYLIAMGFFSEQFRISRALLFGGAGAVALWFSHSVLFILGGLGACTAWYWIRRKDWKKLTILGIAYGCWAVSIAIRYFIFLRHIVSNPIMQDVWGDRFMPFPPSSFAEAMWGINMFFDMIAYVLGLPMFQTLGQIITQLLRILGSLLGVSLSVGLSLPEIVVSFFSKTGLVGLYLLGSCAMLIGGIVLVSKSKFTFCLLSAPILLNLIASVLHQYPFGNRVGLYLIPLFYIFLGEGIAWIFQKSKKRSFILAAMLLCALWIRPMYFVGHHLLEPRKHEEARPVLQYLKEHKQEGDILYVYYACQGVYKYYARRLGLDEENYIAGIMSREDWRKYLDDLNQLRGHERVWVFMSHAYSEEDLFVAYLDQIGTRLDESKDVRASVYLYDLQ